MSSVIKAWRLATMNSRWVIHVSSE